MATFQSPPPRREVTTADADGHDRRGISIHTSPKGGDFRVIHARAVMQYFNPHLPEGR